MILYTVLSCVCHRNFPAHDVLYQKQWRVPETGREPTSLQFYKVGKEMTALHRANGVLQMAMTQPIPPAAYINCGS